jgi:hypothetical protein
VHYRAAARYRARTRRRSFRIEKKACLASSAIRWPRPTARRAALTMPMPHVPSTHEIIRLYNLKADEYDEAKAIRDALKDADKRDEALRKFREAPTWGQKTLRFSHGTSWENAVSIREHGFATSADGCLGPGIYVGRTDKALNFAKSAIRHGGNCGGLVEVAVTIRKPKFVTSDDTTWQAEGYDACRAEGTTFSNKMEWCIKSPSQVQVLKIYPVHFDDSAERFPLEPAAPTGGAADDGSSPRSDEGEQPRDAGALTLSLLKPRQASKTGIRLAGAQGAPRVVELSPSGLAAHEPAINRLRPGDLILEVNHQAADGHQATSVSE